MQVGWWNIDVGRLTFTRPQTGQTVSYEGDVGEVPSLHIDSSPNQQWMRLDYRDADCRFPLLVQRRNIPDERGGRATVWRLDYNRSAKLWAREAKQPIDFPASPPYGLWLRVDACVKDALCCWPRSRSTGPAPTAIALEGGWHNGAWSPALYRSQRAINDSDFERGLEAVASPWMPPLDSQPSAPWQFVPVENWGNSSPSDWGLPLRLHADRIDRPHMARQDGRAVLVPIAARPRIDHRNEPDWRELNVRLLYVDEDIACDAIEAQIRQWSPDAPEAVDWSVATNFVADGIKAVNRTTGESPAAFEDTPWSHQAKTRNYNWEPLDDDLRHRLARSLSEAILTWQTAKLRLPEPGGALHEFVLPQATLIDCPAPFLAGARRSTCRQKTALALHPGPAGRAHPMARLFEEDDGILRVEQRTEHLGWWDYDPESLALVNRLSEQRLTFAGPFSGHKDIAVSEPGERQWFRFDYADRIATFPVLARRAHRGLNGPLTGAWEVDYNRSLRLWQREDRKAPKVPAYGLWRRVDDCVSDALACWPELEHSGEIAAAVSTVGGWSNGAWAELLRSYLNAEPLKRLQNRSDDSLTLYVGEVEAPILEPLRAPVPAAWRFFDAPVAEAGALIDGLAIDEAQRQLSLPPDAALKGFEQHVPYVRRDDGAAVLFPHGLKSSLFRGEDYTVEAETIYVDETALALLRARWEHVNLWSGVIARGLRREAAEAEHPLWRLHSHERYRMVNHYPSLRLFRNLQRNLSDAWLAWSGCDKRILDDPAYIEKINQRDWFKTEYATSGYALKKPHNIRFQGVYLAGLFFPMASKTVELKSATEEADARERGARADAAIQQVIDRLKLANRRKT